MDQKKLFSKNFTLVILGQIISLFGNATIRFTLPLYLLDQTGSPVLYGTVTACAFIPAILLSPIGGIIADRVNKRNVMVILDFFTAGIILAFSMLMDSVDLIPLLAATLMILYGIAGVYQPSVQASIPALVDPEHFMAANSITNMINSFAALLGPVLGGIMYSAYGTRPVLWVCMVCFFISAVMEMSITIPFTKQASDVSLWKTVSSDLTESIQFIRKERPVLGKVLLMTCGINLFLSAMIMVAMPYMITEVLDLGTLQAARLYGAAEGALAAGGLAGGVCAGIFADRLKIQHCGDLIMVCAVCAFPMGFACLLSPSGLLSYLVMTVCGFIIMVCSTIFSVQMLSFVQTETPQNLIGKVIAVILTIAMCAQPLGSTLYGLLFGLCKGYESLVILFAGAASLLIAIGTKNIFKKF